MASRLDPQAVFEDLFDRYEKKVFNLIYRLVGDYEDAADLTSDTFVQAYRHLEQFRAEAQAYTWLYRIAVNLCKNHYRRKGVRDRTHAFSLDEQVDLPEGELDRELADWSLSPARQVEARELQVVLQQSIAELPPEAREVVVLRDLQGLSYQEIGEVLGVSSELVKSRLFRARSVLRKKLTPYLLPEA